MPGADHGIADLLIVHGLVFRGFLPGRAISRGSDEGPAPDGAPSAVAMVGDRIAWVGAIAGAAVSATIVGGRVVHRTIE